MNKEPTKTNPSLYVLLSILGTSATGFSPIFVRLSEVGPVAIAFWRMILSVPFMLIWVYALSLKQKSNFYSALKDVLCDGWLVRLAGLCFALDLGLWHISITMTSVVNASLFNNLSAIFVPIFAWYLGYEKLTIRYFIALMGAFAGIFILIGDTFSLHTSHIWGDLLAIASAVFYSCYILLIKNLRQRHSSPPIMASVGLVSSVILFIFAIGLKEIILPTTLNGTAVILGSALVPQICGQGLLILSLRHLPPSLASMIMLLQPLVAAILAWFLFNETMTLSQLGGGVVLLISILYAQRAVQLASNPEKKQSN
ncbi:MAG: conserved rane protein of unknown function [Chlamydiales bacterium]|jgi:drug/metabolite transporter (DMT)-like permease|nr:conserved rane protein of unknown function [Chlamydiales bacterium]